MMTHKKQDAEVIDITKIIEARKPKIKEENEYIPDSELYDVADLLVKISIMLDSLGQSKYGDKISDVVEEMFSDKEITPQMWGWNPDNQ